MTDETKPPIDDVENVDDLESNDDIELVINYLNGHLDPEGMEAVRKRLEEDADFRDFAEPLLITWSVPKHIVRHPRPAGELEREWAKFAKRAGIVLDEPQPEPPPPPKRSRWGWSRWSNWKRFRVMMLLMIGAFYIGAQMMVTTLQDQLNQAPPEAYTLIHFDTGWISLGDGIEVQTDPATSLMVDDQRVDGMMHVVLSGMARFRVLPTFPQSPALRERALYIETSAGSVWAGESDFSVTARDSSTAVLVHALGPRRAARPGKRTVMMSAKLPGEGALVALLDHERARMVRGQDPQRVFVLP